MPVNITMDIEGVEESVAKISKLSVETKARLQTVVKSTAIDVQGRAKELAPVNTNRLRSSIHIIFDSDKLGASIGPSTPIYDSVMEYGRKVGAKMPPFGPGSNLYRWVQLHGMVKKSSNKATYHGISIAAASYDAQSKRMAFIVARSIAKKGIRPRRYMQLAWDPIEAKFRRNVEAAINGAVAEVST